MLKKKKAQTSMEYLMTYGWAIIIVLIALATLFYLGVFSPNIPDICIVDSPFTCDITIKGNELIIGLNVPLNIEIQEINNIKIGEQEIECVFTEFEQNKQNRIICTIPPNAKGKIDFDIIYSRILSSIEHGVKGKGIVNSQGEIDSPEQDCSESDLVADAGENKIVLPHTWVNLNGSNSQGNIISYNWEQVSDITTGFCGNYETEILIPEENLNQPNARFLALKYSKFRKGSPENIIYKLTIEDSDGCISEDNVSIQIDFPENERTLVIYAENWDTSIDLANYYMEQRNIPNENIFGVTTDLRDKMYRSYFDSSIRFPLMNFLETTEDENGILLKDKIKYIAVMAPIAFWVKGCRADSCSQACSDAGHCYHNADLASVDSEIAVIFHPDYVEDGTGHLNNLGIANFGGNLIYSENYNTEDLADILGCENVWQKIYFVSRLDYGDNLEGDYDHDENVQNSMILIDDAIYAEQQGTNGGLAYVDLDPDMGISGNTEFLETASFMEEKGFEIYIDEEGNLFETVEAPFHYIGWYSFHYNTLFTNVKIGAVGFHRHSWSDFRAYKYPTQGSGGWSYNMLRDGFTCVYGTITEPYGSGMPRTNNIYDLILNYNYSVVEAHYNAIPYLSWTNEIICDPLYHPPLPE
ncbi:TIGR03790 family protein [archaeon]|nr:TIGR03790 family protein [archaeon]